MKLSTNFTLFGLNVKAIQAYLKEQAKDRRGVRITCRRLHGTPVTTSKSFAAASLKPAPTPCSMRTALFKASITPSWLTTPTPLHGSVPFFSGSNRPGYLSRAAP